MTNRIFPGENPKSEALQKKEKRKKKKGAATMNWLNKLERKLGRYAIPNLILYLIGAYSIGFVLNMVAPSILNYLNFQPYYILHGQIWRLVTWIFMPTDSNILFLIIMMMLYYQLGMALERTW